MGENFFYVLEENQDLRTVCELFNITEADLVELNGASSVASGDKIVVYQNNILNHIVQPAETIDSIAAKYGLLAEDIVRYNKIDKVYTGQHIKIVAQK